MCIHLTISKKGSEINRNRDDVGVVTQALAYDGDCVYASRNGIEMMEM